MVNVERIDIPKSFITILRFNDGDFSEEVPVYVWEADAIQTKLNGITLATVTQLYNKTGKSIIKTW